ncbi:hypothetical protein HPB50_029225 [Hyalomma asiaticum]|nr:hypothetical protein HPB50_029225 [Hyalomma asiaticum]
MADAASSGHPTQKNHAANSAALHGGSARKPGPVWKPKPLPWLHREDLVIILKPGVTVALKDYANMASWEQCSRPTWVLRPPRRSACSPHGSNTSLLQASEIRTSLTSFCVTFNLTHQRAGSRCTVT